MRARLVLPWAAILAVWPCGRLAAQASDALYTRLTALSGGEIRGYRFDPGISVKSVWQWNLPVIVVTPVGRQMSVDLTTHVAGARVSTFAGEAQTLSGLTDTQLRLLYTLGRDRLVTSLAVTLPTGRRTLSNDEFLVSGAVGSTYLSFPVSNFGTGFGVTGGVAYAQTVGSWNVGLSGSLRYVGGYAPFSDTAQQLTYEPGLEGRLRGGADRLLGQRARLQVGLTLSTFSTDEFTGTGTLVSSGWYDPGMRLIGDVAYVRVIGRSTLSVTAWDFYRRAGLSNTGPNPETKENVFNVEGRLALPIGRRLELEPMAAFRQWNPADYRGGRLYSGGVTVRWAFTDHLSATLGGRYDDGWIFARDRGFATLTGYGATLFVRYQR